MFRRARGNYRNIPPRKAGAAGPPPPINFASLWPGVFQLVQSDMGLQYGAVMRADAANTSSVAFALTGATPAVPVPIWIRITAAGIGNVYFDGLGVTPAMVGVPIVDSSTIVLTGAGSGMGITPGVGSQIAGNTWRATCSQLGDQSGNGKPYTQLTPANQPTVEAGPNGKPRISFDAGLANYMVSTLATPQPSITPYSVYLAMSVAAKGGQQNYIGSTGSPGAATLFDAGGTGTSIQQYNGAGANASAMTVATLTRIVADFTGSASDRLKSGALPFTISGLSAGDSAGVAQALGAATVGGPLPANMKILMLGIGPRLTDPQYLALDAALNSVPGYGPGSVLV